MEKSKSSKKALLCVLFGTAYFLIGILQQYMVNSLHKTARVGLVVSLLFALVLLVKKEEKIKICLPRGDIKRAVLLILSCAIAMMNLAGCFMDSFLMLSFLGITSFVTGIILTVSGLIAYFKNGRKIILKIVLPVLSVISFIVCGFFSLTTISPATTTSLFGPAIMGSGSSNVWDAEQKENILEDGTRLVSDIKYDDQIPNGYLDIYYTNEEKYIKAPTFILMA